MQASQIFNCPDVEYVDCLLIGCFLFFPTDSFAILRASKTADRRFRDNKLIGGLFEIVKCSVGNLSELVCIGGIVYFETVVD